MSFRTMELLSRAGNGAVRGRWLDRLEAQAGGGRGCGGRGTVGGTGFSSICGVVLSGCRDETPAPVSQAPSFPGISIKVGALGDVAILAGVSPQRGEWEASRKGTIVIRDESLTLETLSSVDVVLFPAQRLGDLVDAGVLAPIPNAAVLPPKPPESEAGSGRPARAGRGEGRGRRYVSVHGHRPGVS